MPVRLVVLVSGTGSNLQALLDATADPAYGAQVVAVGADRPGIPALDKADAAGVPSFVVRVRDFADREAWDVAFAEAVAAHQPDLIVSAGFMKLAGPAFLRQFEGRYINTHPALLPSFPGMHGARDALAYGVKVTGCTLFVVDDGVDSGAIVAQATRAGRGRRRRALPARAHQGRRAHAPRRHRGPDGPRWMVHPRQKGHDPLSTNESTDDDNGRGRRPVRRALVSVYDKTGLVELAQGLHAAGVALVSTGSTAARIAEAGVPVTEVADLTGFPECLDGRVKTLHPRVHAGLLADVRRPEHTQQLADLEIEAFELLISNLYPFAETVASGASQEESIEQIDIGGPSMVRGAAKNHANVAVVVSPDRYTEVLEAVAAGGFTLQQRQSLAMEAFRHTATYDVAVASWMGSIVAPDAGPSGFPGWVGGVWQRYVLYLVRLVLLVDVPDVSKPEAPEARGEDRGFGGV